MKKADLIALLIGIGVSQVNATKIAAGTPDDFTPTEAIDQAVLISEFKTNQIALLKNDATIVAEIQGAEKAKNFDQFERKMKQVFALTSEEIKDKKFDEIIAIAKAKIGTGADKTTTELQEQLLALENKVKDYEDVQIPKIKGEVAVEKKKFELGEKFKSAIPKTNEKGEDILRMPFDTVHKLLKLDLEEAYDFDTDDKGAWVIKQKGTDLLAKSADGTKFLSMDEFVNGRLEHHKALVKSNAGGAGAGTGTGKPAAVIDGADVKEKTAGQLKAEKNLEALKASTTPTV